MPFSIAAYVKSLIEGIKRLRDKVDELQSGNSSLQTENASLQSEKTLLESEKKVWLLKAAKLKERIKELERAANANKPPSQDFSKTKKGVVKDIGDPEAGFEESK